MDALSAGNDWHDLSTADQAMLAYSRRLTLSPRSVTQEDVESLRRQRFSDRQILEINLAAAYMNFVNRVAEGLGVELEPSLQAFTR